MFEIFKYINWQIEEPLPYGLFHFLSFLIMIFMMIFIIIQIRKNKDKTMKIVLLLFSIIFIVLEILKQGLYTYVGEGYRWYAFPFQFCSMPIYITPLTLIFKNQKIKSALYSFLGFFGLLGGLSVMLYPADVFTKELFISIQTMVHHGLMVILGVSLIVANYVKLNINSFFSSFFVFGITVLIALGLNITFNFVLAEGTTFNMFFISPYGENHLPVYNLIQAKAPYIVFLISYVFGFGLGAFIVMHTAKFIKLFSSNLKRKKEVRFSN